MNNLVSTCQKVCGLLLLLAAVLFGKEVCKISYHDFPAELDGITIEVPDDAVSLSEAITIKQPDDSSVTLMNTPAIMFVIDNSGSMFIPHQYGKNYPDTSYELPRDPDGNRFTVTMSLIDSLYKKDPSSEVGLTIFGSELHFDTTGELGQVVKTHPFSRTYGSFKVFLQLNKEYTEKGKTRTGYDFLKYYLESEIVTDTIAINTGSSFNPIWIRDTIVEFRMLKNLRSDFRDYTGTNIDLAFNAVKKALPGASAQKKNQYTIFFSDGVPSGSSGNEFADGKDVPTTYTVFFSPDMVAPDILKTMNKNIQENGFSSSNPKSELWPFDNSSHEELLEFMVENILNKLNADITTEPVEIKINGKSNGDWIDGQFVFTEQFPLIGELSPFKFDISYSILTKTSDGTEQLDTINEEVDFSVERFDNPSLLDSLEIEYWDRDILFYKDGSKLGALDETSTEFELRFKESRVDCNYRYRDVEILLTSAKMGDELLVALNEKDEHNFRKMVTVDFKANSADNSDAVLQIAPDDTVYAFFQNPSLPLDTLTALLGTDINNSITIDSAIYYDENADGFVDKISLAYSSLLSVDEAMEEPLVDLITLPSFREFEITDMVIKSDKILLTVKEDRENFQTFCSSKDVITIAEKDLGSVVVENCTIAVQDSVAPVLLDTILIVERGVDETVLTCIFSEDVQEITTDKPLAFYSGTSSYDVTLEEKESKGTRYRFIVSEGGEQFENGDSVHISYRYNSIGDTLDNWQRNQKNVKRLLTVVDEIVVNKAAYFDGDRDGHPDTVAVELISHGDLDEVDVTKLIEFLELPSFRNFKVYKDEAVLDEKKLIIPVAERREQINTAVTDDDLLAVSAANFGSCFISDAAVAIQDSMAPVIKSNPVLYINTLSDEAEDTLKVQFSEEVEEPDEERLLRFFREKSSFEGELKLISFDTDNATFVVDYFTKDKKELLQGDSVNVNYGLYDLNDNEQKSSRNIKRPIDVKLLLPKVTVSLVAVNPYSINKTVVPEEIIDLLEDVEDYELDQSDSGYVGCLIMTQFEPSSLLGQVDCEIEGVITLLDKVGNTLVEKVDMEFVKELGQLVYIWNGKNSFNRTVGSDSFVASAAIKLRINDSKEFQFQKDLLITTQEE